MMQSDGVVPVIMAARVPLAGRMPILVADSADPLPDQWVTVLRAEQAALYRTAVCDSGNNGPTAWRISTVIDRQTVVRYAVSGPGRPATITVPWQGGEIAAMTTMDTVSGTRPNAFTLIDEAAGDGQVRCQVWETDGLVDGDEPPTVVHHGDAATFSASGSTTLAVAPGLYVVERGEVSAALSGGVFSAIALNGIGFGYAGTTSLSLAAGSPIVSQGDGLTLEYTVSASLTADVAIVLRRDDRSYLEVAHTAFGA